MNDEFKNGYNRAINDVILEIQCLMKSKYDLRTSTFDMLTLLRDNIFCKAYGVGDTEC